MQAFKLQHPEYLLALINIVMFLALFLIARRWRSQALKRFGESGLVGRLHPFAAPGRRWVKWMLGSLAFAALVLAIANPLIGRQKEKTTRVGIDVVLAIDISNSMLAEDVKPSRLERTRQFALRLADALEGDRLGLILFAGRAYRQLPLTSDREIVKMFIRNMSTDLAPAQGTAIGDAISLTMQSYSGEEKKPLAMLIISDGEDHEPGAEELAKQASEQGITIFTIGIGTPRGAPIPEYYRGQMIGYKSDPSGNIVLSKMNEQELSRIASAGKGVYMPFTGNPDQVKRLRDEFGKIEQRSYEELEFDAYNSWYQVPLALALLLMLIEVLIVETRRNWMTRIKPLEP